MKSVVILTIICLISAFLLGYANHTTAPKRAENAAAKLEESKREVLTTDIVANIGKITELKEIDGVKFYDVVSKNNERLALIAEFTGKGYGGDIKLLAGINHKNYTILGLKPLAHSETPGLGAKIQEINNSISKKLAAINPLINPAKPWFCEQFKAVPHNRVVLKKDGGAIDAITASTITSRAVTNAVYKALDLSKKVDLTGGEDINAIDASAAATRAITNIGQ